MSDETIRSYSSNARRFLGTHRRRLLSLRWKLLLVACCFFAYAWWTTRDTFPMERLIPSDQKYQIYANDILSRRGTLAASQIWKAMPDSHGIVSIPEMLGRDLEMPAWLLNNLVPNACYVSGNDLKTFDDVLFVSRMTAFGCFLTKFRAWAPGISNEPAGGLNIDHHKGTNFYFAVRGRTLVLSRSRETLIHALTLRSEDGLPSGSIEQARAESGAEDLRGTVAFLPDDPLGNVFQSFSFAVRVEPAGARVKCRAALRPEWITAIGEDPASLKPMPLIAPPEGLAGLSMNLGRSVRDTWLLIGKFNGQLPQYEQLWDSWVGSSENASGPLAIVMRTLGPLGPGIRFTWQGIDLNEIFPAPELVMTLDTDPAKLTTTFESLPPPPEGSQPWDTFPRYDAATKRVTAPMFGGPSLQPTAGLLGDTLLISSSQARAEALFAQSQPPQPLPQPGNLYVCAKPRLCFEAYLQLAQLLAENHLLKNGVTVETLPGAVAKWQTMFSVLENATLFSTYENGELTVELNATCSKDS